MKQQAFPKDFLWGASTAAHQVEGDTHNQWTEWEKANAERLAQTAEQRLGWLPNWQDIKADATNPENYISGRGIEHYSRYQEDFNLLKQLNMNAFRFGIEWARIEPEEGKWDEKEIEHYRRYLLELKRQHIEPVVTLWHWTLPVWFAQKEGFARRRNVRYFERYAAKIAQELGDLFTYVVPLNEPSVYTSFSYVLGEWAPQQKNLLQALRVYNNLAAAHKSAACALKREQAELLVGAATHFGDMLPTKPSNLASKALVSLKRYVWNYWFIDRIRYDLDFIGVNFYHTDRSNWFGKICNPKQPVNDLGWYMEPKGLARVLEQLWGRYKKPMIITENGVADAKDAYRKWWLEETLRAMQDAIAHGVDVRGYLHWSLLDNFEWAYGWWPKFGLVAVDRQTMKRTIRPSAKWLASYLAQLNVSESVTAPRVRAPKRRQLSQRRGR